jgi:hypothetical protein
MNDGWFHDLSHSVSGLGPNQVIKSCPALRWFIIEFDQIAGCLFLQENCFGGAAVVDGADFQYTDALDSAYD